MISPPSVPMEEWFQALRVPKSMDVQVSPIEWHSWGGEAARLAESLSAMHRVLGLIPEPYKPGMVVQAFSVCTMEVEAKDKKLRIIILYIATLRSVWTTRNPISKGGGAQYLHMNSTILLGTLNHLWVTCNT